MKKKHTKSTARLRDVKERKDYSLGEASPYRNWLERRGDYKQEHDANEPPQANPDSLSEENSIYYQAPCEDPRLEIIQAVEQTLTEKQRQILRMCGNEGRTIESTAHILGISRGAVQTTLDRIREKVSVLQKRSLLTNKREG